MRKKIIFAIALTVLLGSIIASSADEKQQRGLAAGLPPFPERFLVEIAAGDPAPEGAEPYLIQRLMFLVRSHPDSVINQLLDREFVAKRLYFSFNNLKDESGQLACFVTVMVEPGQLTPMMFFDYQQLAHMKSDEDNMRMWLVITHEASHYQQWLRTSNPREREVYSFGGLEPLDWDGCQYFLAGEVEAFTNECKLANYLGRPDLVEAGELCQYVGKDQFEEIVGSFLSNHVPLAAQCREAWAR